jgi:hypothetical protein
MGSLLECRSSLFEKGDFRILFVFEALFLLLQFGADLKGLEVESGLNLALCLLA